MRLLLPFLLLTLSLPAAAQKIAIWNPEQGTSQPPNRFVLDLPRLAQTSQYLQDAGLPTEKLTAAQLADETVFNANKYDALVMPGDSFPKIAIKSLQDFGDSGGILIALNARIPFNARVEQVANGQWDLTPNQGFAWQSMELLNPLGIKYIYDPQRHDQGVLHTPSPLFTTYVPQAPVVKRKMPSMWLIPTPGSQFFPLIRSQRSDGADVQPQLFVTRNGKRTAIISLSPVWTQDTDPATWSLSKETSVALAKLALDLKAGKVKLIRIPRSTFM